MATPQTPEEAVRLAALSPKKTEWDNGKQVLEQHSLSDLIDAANYTTPAAEQPHRGVYFGVFRSPPAGGQSG